MLSLARLAAAALVTALATFAVTTAPAHADIVPAGSKYIDVNNFIKGTASLGDMKLVLLTRGYRGLTEVDTNVSDGRLAVTGGYMSATILVALTPAQWAELQKVAGGNWQEFGEIADRPRPLHDFFQRKDLVTSSYIGYRSLVPRDDKRNSIDIHWVITGIAEGRITMTSDEPSHSGNGTGLVEASGAPLAIGLATALLAVAGIVLAWRMRARTSA